MKRGGQQLFEDDSSTNPIITTPLEQVTECNDDHSNSFAKRVAFTFLGIGILLPWNVFVSAEPYFGSRLCDDDDPIVGSVNDNIGNRKNLGSSFMLWFSLLYNASGVCTLAILILLREFRNVSRNDNSTSISSSGHDVTIDVHDACSPTRTPMRDSKEQLEVDELRAHLVLVHDGKEVSTDREPNDYKCCLRCLSQSFFCAPRNTNTNSSVVDYKSNQNFEKKSGGRSIVIALILNVLGLLFAALLSLAPSPSAISANNFLRLSLLGSACCGCFGAVASSGILKFTSLFPGDQSVCSYISGQAIGGVLISVLNLIAAIMRNRSDLFFNKFCDSDKQSEELFAMPRYFGDLMSNNDKVQASCAEYVVDWGTFFYFISGCILLVICIAFFVYLDSIRPKPAVANSKPLRKNSIDENERLMKIQRKNRYYCDNSEGIQGKYESNDNFELYDGEPTHLQPPKVASHGDKWLCCDYFANNEGVWSSHWLELENDDKVTTRCDMDYTPSSKETQQPLLVNEEMINKYEQQNEDGDIPRGNLAFFVCKQLKVPLLMIFITFFITLSVYPNWITKLQSKGWCQDQHNRLSNELFIPLLIATFNIFDWVGRITAGNINLDKVANLSIKLMLTAGARLVFLPLFLFCFASGSTITPSTNIFFNDFYPICFLVLFAFTNGLVTTLSFMYAPRLIPSNDEVQCMSSTILNFTVGIGVLSGSLFSFVYNYIGTGEW